MSLQAISKATSSSVEMSYDPEQSYLYVSIDRRVEDPSRKRPLRSWTPFATTLDYDAAKRIRGIEIMLPPLESRVSSISAPERDGSYADLVLEAEYAAKAEVVAYDPDRKTLLIEFDGTDHAEAHRAQAIGDNLLFDLRDGRLRRIWLTGLVLKIG
jgi:hypothetical protein